MSRTLQIVVLLMLFIGGAIAAWSLAKDGLIELRSTLELMKSGEIEDIKKLNDIKAAVQALPPSSSSADVVRLLDREIVRHVLLLSALKPKADKLRNNELKVLCQLAKSWGAAQRDGEDEPIFSLASNQIRLLEKDVKPEIEKRQSAGGGKECTIEGVEPSTREILKKHPFLKE